MAPSCDPSHASRLYACMHLNPFLRGRARSLLPNRPTPRHPVYSGYRIASIVVHTLTLSLLSLAITSASIRSASLQLSPGFSSPPTPPSMSNAQRSTPEAETHSRTAIRPRLRMKNGDSDSDSRIGQPATTELIADSPILARTSARDARTSVLWVF